METIDIFIAGILVIGLVSGFSKGFLRQLATILGLILGLLAARAMFGALAEQITPYVNGSLQWAKAISFFLIWLAVPLVFMLVASLIAKALNMLSLGWINRLLGAILGLLKYALFMGLLISCFEYIDPHSRLISKNLKEKSMFYNPVKHFVQVFVPFVEQVSDTINETEVESPII